MPRAKKRIVMFIQGHVTSLTMVRFSKMLPRFTKKSQGQPVRTRLRTGNPAIFTVWGTRYNNML